MSVLLRRSAYLSEAAAYDVWACCAGEAPDLPTDRRMHGLGTALERAFEAEAEHWLELAADMSRTPSARLSQTAACAANISDFGEMLAWTRLVDVWAGDAGTRVLVVCNDPWLFRHLTARPGVTAGAPPPLARRELALALRGWTARAAYALRAAADVLRLRAHRRAAPLGASWLLVYGHPASSADGYDGYFGTLLENEPGAVRALHVDCAHDRARALAADRRTVSLRAWGGLAAALALPFARWRPRAGCGDWLTRRAAALEGGTAQAAAIRWQQVCQRAWLCRAAPRVVAWPWENHAWERDFARAARGAGVQTVGYQHSVIGRHMLNYAAAGRPGGEDALPETILCTGAATRDRLTKWGVAKRLLDIGGTLRFAEQGTVAYGADAPVFVALPFDPRIAGEMLAAVEAAPDETSAREIRVREHPMNPYPVAARGTLVPARAAMTQQPSLSAVVYAATTVGIEALLAGIPTLRFLSSRKVALDILPDGVDAPAADADGLGAALAMLAPPPALDRESIFAAPDMALWKSVLNPG